MNGFADVTLTNPASSPTDLSSWDTLQDLDFAGDLLEQCLPAEAAKASSKDRQREKNRQAQKRARQKKKVSTLPTAASVAVLCLAEV